MSKYNIGDKVRVRKDLVADTRYGVNTFIEEMERMRGKIVTIASVGYGGYRVEGDFFGYTDEMFEPLEEPTPTPTPVPAPAHIILVKHHQNSKKQFVFEVPDEMVGSLRENMKVRVSTRRGIEEGITTTNVISGEGAMRIAQMFGAVFPLQKVVLTQRMELSKVIVPELFRNSLPCPEKICQCYSYYRKFRKFDRDIVVDIDNVICDGYVALLVARMLGIETLEVVESKLSFRKYRSSRGDY